MTRQFDHTALLAAYVRLIARRFRGDDQLDEFSGFTVAERSEIRRLGEGGPINPMELLPERIGGTSKKFWFSELNNLPLSEQEKIT